MDPNTLKLLMGSAGAGAVAEKLYIEDVFSTWLYTGTGASQTIANGIDLSGKGGLAWIKGRSGNTGHRFVDTVRGATKSLESNSTAVEATESTGLTAFSSTGFSLGADTDYNTNTATYTSWTFRKAAKFFDVVTWTGNGATTRTIAHSLGSVPGFIVCKPTSDFDNWRLYHRSLSQNNFGIALNTAAAGGINPFDYGNGSTVTTPTSSVFTVGQNLNSNGATYVAYLFAHDAGGFGDSGNDNVVSCGSYTGNGSTSGPTVTLGWEPQWLLIKRTNSTGDWNLIDNLRGFVLGGTDAELNPNLISAESPGTFVSPLATGFQLNTTDTGYNASGGSYIYIAIRRGPMKTPTDATKVFEAVARNSTNPNLFNTALPYVDAAFNRVRSFGNLGQTITSTRLTGQGYLLLPPAGIENTASSFEIQYDFNNKINPYFYTPTVSEVNWLFRRAPGFFDVVAYTGDGTSNRSLAHNLGVTPELIIVKSRNDSGSWRVWSASFADSSANLDLNGSGAPPFANNFFPATGRNNSNFIVNSSTNTNTTTFVAYLFASCTGVSKVGSYTGTGTTLSVDCGFTAGARFVLIKRTDSTGDWYVWDTARGIVSGNDPFLLLNSRNDENTSTDYIDPLSTGFQISSTAPAAINASGGTYIYLSVA